MKLALICGATKMTMRQEYLKNIGVTKAGPLDLLLKDITSLCLEAMFYDHNAYYFRTILDKIWLLSMCQSKYAMPPVYIQGSHWGHFNKIEDFLSHGDSTYFIFLASKVDSIFFQISDFSD